MKGPPGRPASRLSEQSPEAAEHPAQSAQPALALGAAQHRAEIAQRAFTAEMRQDLLQHVRRQAGRIRRARNGVAGLCMRGAERSDRGRYLFGRQADAGGEIGDLGIAGDLAEESVQ